MDAALGIQRGPGSLDRLGSQGVPHPSLVLRMLPWALPSPQGGQESWDTAASLPLCHANCLAKGILFFLIYFFFFLQRKPKIDGWEAAGGWDAISMQSGAIYLPRSWALLRAGREQQRQAGLALGGGCGTGTVPKAAPSPPQPRCSVTLRDLPALWHGCTRWQGHPDTSQLAAD